MRIILSLAFCALVYGTAAYTADKRPPAAPAPPPPPAEDRAPSRSANGESFEPEITITSKGTEIHEEYRYKGQLYMVKVIPAKGAPYYLIYDERGNARHSDLEPDIVAPSWVIKRF